MVRLGLTKTFEEGCHKAILLSTEDIMIYFPEVEKNLSFEMCIMLSTEDSK